MCVASSGEFAAITCIHIVCVGLLGWSVDLVYLHVPLARARARWRLLSSIFRTWLEAHNKTRQSRQRDSDKDGDGRMHRAKSKSTQTRTNSARMYTCTFTPNKRTLSNVKMAPALILNITNHARRRIALAALRQRWAMKMPLNVLYGQVYMYMGCLVCANTHTLTLNKEHTHIHYNAACRMPYKLIKVNSFREQQVCIM